MTQKMEWKNQPEDYDYQQEVARAAFADMLHDDERVMMGQFTVQCGKMKNLRPPPKRCFVRSTL